MSFYIIIPRNQAWLAAGWCPSQWLRGEKHCKEKISTSIVFIIVFSLRFTTSFLHMQITCCSRNTITAEKNPRLDLEHVAHKKMTTVQTQRQKQKRGAEKACVCVCDWRSWSVRKTKLEGKGFWKDAFCFWLQWYKVLFRTSLWFKHVWLSYSNIRGIVQREVALL